MKFPLTISLAITNPSAVARKLRLQSEGAMYHVMNRGDHLEAIFRGVADRELFLKSLGETCAKTDWRRHHDRRRIATKISPA